MICFIGACGNAADSDGGVHEVRPDCRPASSGEAGRLFAAVIWFELSRYAAKQWGTRVLSMGQVGVTVRGEYTMGGA